MGTSPEQRSAAEHAEEDVGAGATVGHRASVAEGICSIAQVLRLFSGIFAIGAPCLCIGLTNVLGFFLPVALGSGLCLVATGMALLAGKSAARKGETQTVARAQRVASASSIQAACLSVFAAAGICGLGLLLSLS